MAKVSLRIYNREIESLIDQGSTNEAVAHCRHILKTFPKHLETYRLLGKAYLESKRYPEAVDIFTRILMAVPDDFVAHVGMSIIRDEENKLDDSIWHMQRAFETQPANPAIQGELQRLYGRRDGMEPPKIRMTRGALAQMYLQGELYPQAIAEIRATLVQDPQRSDMQVLLARAYFNSGQKADASDMCMQLLKRYAHCFDANRIMVELLPTAAGAAENTQVYRMRVGELDPYATFAKGSVFQSAEVADAAINLERLEYKAEEAPAEPEGISSFGIGFGTSSSVASSSEQPDWLKSGGFDAAPIPPLAPPPAIPQSTEGIPDFLRSAGWGESNTPEQPSSIFDEEPVSGDLAPAEIPEWLKGQVPTNSAQPAASQPLSHSIETPDWLSGLDDAKAAEPAQAGNAPDWLSGLGDAKAAEPVQAVNAPDWLSGLGDAKTPEPAQADNAPDWLSGFDDSKTPEPAQAGNVPDWLGNMDSQNQKPSQPAPSVESLGSSAQEQDDAVAWLESLAAKHGAKPEELVTDPNKRFEKPPEWVTQATQSQAQPAPAPSVESLGSSAQEQDDAVAWLESLAAKHGAKPEELVTDPNKRFEKPPEWVSQATQSQAQPAPVAPVPAQPAPSVESLGSSAQEQDDAVAWLESLAAKHGAKPEELVTDPNKRFEKPPEWVTQATQSQTQPAPVENAMNIGEQFFADFEDASTAEPAKPIQSAPVENAMNIGEQFFADFEDASAAEPAKPASDAKDLPDWLSDSQSQPEQLGEDFQRGEIPEWLSDDAQPRNAGGQFDFVEEGLVAQKNDLPNWLSDEEDAAAQSAEPYAAQNDLTDWLSGLDNEPGLPFDKLPTPDSILADAKSAPSSAASVDPQKEESIRKRLAQKEPVPEKLDLPDWLSDVDAQGVDVQDEAEDDWQKSIEQKSVAPAQTEEAASAPLAENLPDWLQGVDEATPAQLGNDIPAWMSDEVEAQPKPTAPSDWKLAEPKPSQPKQPAPPKPPMEKPVAQRPAEKPQPVRKKKPAAPAQTRQPESPGGTVALDQAKGALDRGDIPAALAHYSKLIKKGKHLEETIRDLTESITRYPVEVGVLQTLGDAYMRSNRLKEALDAYNKAEELIR